jgi:hypothetical protein
MDIDTKDSSQLFMIPNTNYVTSGCLTNLPSTILNSRAPGGVLVWQHG